MNDCSVYNVHCTLGWANLYQKFETEEYTVCGKLILPKKIGKALKKKKSIQHF